MKLFPAIDLYEAKAVRLVKGDYQQMTVYSTDPPQVARSFQNAGAEYLHVVDLEGARDGNTANFSTIEAIVKQGGLQVEVGGGIRTEDVIKRYVDLGVLRVILGTAAITRPGFVADMVQRYGEKIAVGVDVRDGMVATHGWTQLSKRSCFDFCREMEQIGVSTIICTDISKDGLLQGTNLELYRQLSETLSLDIVASGGITSLEDIKTLSALGLYGAILGKALYAGNLDFTAALAAAKEAEA